MYDVKNCESLGVHNLVGKYAKKGIKWFKILIHQIIYYCVSTIMREIICDRWARNACLPGWY